MTKMEEYIMIEDSHTIDMRRNLHEERARGTLLPFNELVDKEQETNCFIGNSSQILIIIYEFAEFKYAIVHKSFLK